MTGKTTTTDGRSTDGCDRSPIRRRQFLRGTLAGGAAIGTAGCLDAVPPLGSSIQFGRVDVPSADPPTYRRWIPAPEAASEDSPVREALADTAVMDAAPGRLGKPQIGWRFTFPNATLGGPLDWYGAPFDAYDRAIRTGPVIVLTGGPGSDAATEALDGTRYESVEPYAGYRRYEREDGRRTVAIGDDAIVQVTHEAAPQILRAVVDAGAGRQPRRHEVDDTFETITTAAGRSPWTWIGPDDTDPTGEAITGATSLAFGSDAAYFSYRLLYPSTDIPEAAIRRELRKNERALAADAVQVRTDGRVVTVDIRRHRDRLEPPGPSVPQITWGVETDERTVRFSHEAGQSVDGDALAVDFFPGDRTVEAWSGPVTPGDTISADRPAGSRVRSARLVYRPGDTVVSIFRSTQLP